MNPAAGSWIILLHPDLCNTGTSCQEISRVHSNKDITSNVEVATKGEIPFDIEVPGPRQHLSLIHI